MRVTLELNQGEMDFIASITPDGAQPQTTAKALLRALLLIASQQPKTLAAAAESMAGGVTIPPSGTTTRKGLTTEDYRKALEDSGGNITQAAAALGVHRSTVTGIAARHNLPVQSERGRPARTGYSSHTPEERREYNRNAKKKKSQSVDQ